MVVIDLFPVLLYVFPQLVALLLELFVELDSGEVVRVILGQIIENTLVGLTVAVALEQLPTDLIDFCMKGVGLLLECFRRRGLFGLLALAVL